MKPYVIILGTLICASSASAMERPDYYKEFYRIVAQRAADRIKPTIQKSAPTSPNSFIYPVLSDQQQVYSYADGSLYFELKPGCITPRTQESASTSPVMTATRIMNIPSNIVPSRDPMTGKSCYFNRQTAQLFELLPECVVPTLIDFLQN